MSILDLPAGWLAAFLPHPWRPTPRSMPINSVNPAVMPRMSRTRSPSSVLSLILGQVYGTTTAVTASPLRASINLVLTVHVWRPRRIKPPASRIAIRPIACGNLNASSILDDRSVSVGASPPERAVLLIAPHRFHLASMWCFLHRRRPSGAGGLYTARRPDMRGCQSRGKPPRVITLPNTWFSNRRVSPRPCGETTSTPLDLPVAGRLMVRTP